MFFYGVCTKHSFVIPCPWQYKRMLCMNTIKQGIIGIREKMTVAYKFNSAQQFEG